MGLIKSTFKDDECIFLLEDLTGKIKETSFEEKEKNISAGINYSEMITREEPVSDKINKIFISETTNNAEMLAGLVETLAGKIYAVGGKQTIIVSLARAGSPIGVLLKRCLQAHGIDIPHYSVSIIRGKGIDENAVTYIRNHHPMGKIIFVDGWTGKGSITTELITAIDKYNAKYQTNISPDIAVLADPAHIAKINATRDDICIPNACLNSTVSGLVSRTICNDEFLTDDGFHGAVCYEHLKKYDMTDFFLDTISKPICNQLNGNRFEKALNGSIYDMTGSTVSEVMGNISKKYPLVSKSKMKLGIGEASRALIRRKPVALLINNKSKYYEGLSFVTHLAARKEVPIISIDSNYIEPYKCVALLQ